MRNKLKVIAFSLVLSLVLPVFAAAQTTTETRQLKEQARQRIDSVRDQSKQVRVQALKRLGENQVNRTERAINRLQELIDKIEALKTSLQQRGVDTSFVQTLIDKAKATKAEAHTLLADLKAKHSSINPENTEAKWQVQTFMTAMNGIKKKLIDLHRQLVNIIKELRKLEQSATNNSGANAPSEGQ